MTFEPNSLSAPRLHNPTHHRAAPPATFEPNFGQAAPEVLFLARGPGYSLLLTPGALWLSLRNGTGQAAVRIEILGASLPARARGLDPLPGRSHYFRGAGPALTGIPHFAKVRVEAIYPGIDLLLYGSRGQLEYDFLVTPGADPTRIRMRFQGVESLRTDAAGDLWLDTATGRIRQQRPRIFQDTGGPRREVAGRFHLAGARDVRFDVAAYDPTRPLRIDPVLVYSTYLGGDGAISGGSDYGRAVAVDPAGNIYLAGSTEGTALPLTPGAPQQKYGGGATDAFVARFDPSGALLFATCLGGSGADEAAAIALDGEGNVYVTGSTSSANFPTTPDALQAAPAGGTDLFVTKLDPAGAIVFSTLLGGTGEDTAAAIALDPAGGVYITGATASPDFPTSAGALQPRRAGITNAFVTKLDLTAPSLVYSTYLGGGLEHGRALAVDASGRAWIAGDTASSAFPLSPDALQKRLSRADAFVARLNDSGSALLYSTLLGGSGDDSANALTLDAAGNLYVAGRTDSPNLAVTKNAARATYGGGRDGFLIELNDKGSALVYATYLGGSGADEATAVAVDSAGNVVVGGNTSSSDWPPFAPPRNRGRGDGFLLWLAAPEMRPLGFTSVGGAGEDRIAAIALDAAGTAHVAGSTASPDFPATTGPPLQPGGFDAFVAKWSATADSLLMAACFGSGGTVAGEGAADIAVDPEGNAYITGRAFSTNWPTTAAALQPGAGGVASSDAFVAKLDADGKHLLYSTYLGGSGNDSGAAIAVDRAGSAYIAGTTSSPDFPATPAALQKNLAGGSDIFVAKLSPGGDALIYSTYLGGAYDDAGRSIALDAAGNAYVAGQTVSPQFPTTSDAAQPAPAGLWDGVIAKLGPDGSRLLYSTYLGGTGNDSISSIAVDEGGNAHVAGSTGSPDFPITAGALQRSLGGIGDAFLARLNPSGTALTYSTYFGGPGYDTATRLALHSSGIYLAGGAGAGFPITQGAFQPTPATGFLAKLSPAGDSLLYSSFLGGSGTDAIQGLAVDAAGNAYVTGSAISFLFPTTADRLQTSYAMPPEAFLCKIDPEGKRLLYSSLLGGAGADQGTGIAVHSSGNVFVTGQTSSAGFRTSQEAFQTRLAGPANAFVARFDFTRATVPSKPIIAGFSNYTSGASIVSPGSIFVIQGGNLAAESLEFARPFEQASALPQTLAGTQVSVQWGADNVLAPLFSVAPDRIVAQLPYAAQGVVEVVVTAGAEASDRVRLDARTALAIHSVTRPDLGAITRESPLRAGDNLVAWVTGAGPANPSAPTGTPIPSSPAYTVRAAPYVQLVQPGASARLDIQSFVLAPGMIGVAQANLHIPAWVSSDELQWELMMSLAGIDSNRVPVYVYAPAP